MLILAAVRSNDINKTEITKENLHDVYMQGQKEWQTPDGQTIGNTMAYFTAWDKCSL